MKKIIKSLVLSLISFVSILIYSNMLLQNESYNIFISSLFFVLWYFYYKYEISSDKRTKGYLLVLSVVVSLILSIGHVVCRYIYTPLGDIFTIKNIIIVIIQIVGFNFLFYRIFDFMFKKLNEIKFIENHKKMSIKNYLVMVLIIFLCSLIYFIRYYPAIMTPDSYYVIHYSNNFILSDFHTFGHTWWFGIFFHLGKLIFNNDNAAVAFSMINQMVCMSFIFATGIKFLYNKGLKKSICIVMLLFYALNPLYAHYNITLWRDVMFGGSFVLTLISIYEMVDKDKISKYSVILFIVGVFTMLFFRNNGIYVYLFSIPFLIIFLKGKRKQISILTISIAIIYFVIKGPVFDYFKIEKTTSVEAFSIPLQQMARVIATDKEIPDREKEFLERLFDYNLVKTKYTAWISDPIKNITSNDILTNEKATFFKTYLSLLVKYPRVYFEAYFSQTLGYWYPDQIYWATAGESSGFFEEEEVYCTPLTSGIYNDIIDSVTSRKLPLSNLIWSIGLQFILLFISTVICFYKKNKKYVICYVLLYGLWLSIMASTPVFSELRYAYGLFTCMPIFIFMPFIISSKKGSEVK